MEHEPANDPRHTAVHEAGHAVVGRKLGMVCGDATAMPDDDSAGHAITHDPYVTAYAWERAGRFRDMRTIFIGRIIAFMAGREAEDLLLGSEEGGDDDDLYQVTLMLEELAIDADRERTEVRLRRMTRMLVRRHRAVIERVAAELAARPVVPGADLDAMVPGPVRPPYDDPFADFRTASGPLPPELPDVKLSGMVRGGGSG